jgi:hypothetical protein
MMMKQSIGRKGLVFGIVLLFIGVAFLSEVSGSALKTKEGIGGNPSSTTMGRGRLYHESQSNKDHRKWTVMYYMCGDSNLNGYISPLLENLSTIGSSQELTIVALKDNTGPENSALLYFDESGNIIELNDEFGWPDEVDMSDVHVLELFCTQMMEAYPADHYALITYTSAGTGWQEFPLVDNDSNGGRNISTPAFAHCLQRVVENVGHKIDVLFVSCAMSTMELAYEIAPSVDYIVGTQDCLTKKSIVPRFFDAVWDLRNNTDMSPEEFASMAPFRCDPEPFYYREAYGQELPIVCKFLNKLPFPGFHSVIHYSSSSVINLSTINELASKLDNLSLILIAHLVDKQWKEGITRARSQTQEYDKCRPKYPFLRLIYQRYPFAVLAYNCVIDLYNFIEILRYYVDNDTLKNLCNALLDSYNDVVPALKKVSYDNSHGLNIYFPVRKQTYNNFLFNSTALCPYEGLLLSKNTSWDEFLRGYLSVE